MALLRLGFGGIWAANVVYVADPANDFFSSFSQVAASFGASSLGGTGVASFVAANPEFFALLIAGLTVGLAVAFLSDVAVRAACVVGAAFNIVLLATQWALVATVPGGTDVGPQPLYLVGYAAIFWGYEPGVLSLASSVLSLIHI